MGEEVRPQDIEEIEKRIRRIKEEIERRRQKRGLLAKLRERICQEKEYARLLGVYIIGEDGVLRIVIDLVNYVVDVGSEDEQIQSSALWALFQYLGTRLVVLRGAKGFRFSESMVFRTIFPEFNASMFLFIEATSERKALSLLEKVSKSLHRILKKALKGRKIDDPSVDLRALAERIKREVFIYEE